MKYFVSADVHGFYKEWVTALAEKGFDINNPEHKIIVCGDLFDRGSQAKETQAFVMKLLRKNKIILTLSNNRRFYFLHSFFSAKFFDNCKRKF